MIGTMDDTDLITFHQQMVAYIVSHPEVVKVWPTSTGYVMAGVSVLVHRVLTNAGPGQEVDHLNGDGQDNSRKNLRVCTPSRNRSNQRSWKPVGHSCYRGVCIHRSRKGDPHTRWQARIRVDGRTIYLGYFQDEAAAARAYDTAALEHHGPDYRWFNFPMQVTAHMERMHPGYADEPVTETP